MKKILVVEDEKEVQLTIVEILRNSGYEVIPVSDGKEAIEFLQKETPDAIVSDIMMPEVNGYDVLNYFQKSQSSWMVPFIFLSAKSDELDIRRGMYGGADDYLTKPFRAKELLNSIETQLIKKERVIKKYKELFYNISSHIPHELKTPLIPILGYSELIRDSLKSFSNAEVMEMLDRIIHSGKRLNKTVNKFLRYADTELKLSEKDFSKEYAANAPSVDTYLISRYCKSRSEEYERVDDLTVNVHYALIRIHERDLQYIIEELLDNALKFSLKGSKIIVEGKPSTDKYIITVMDHGKGMTHEQMTKIYPLNQPENEMYQQAENGLGLVTVRKLMYLYNGKFELDSKINEFTKCTISLPLISEEQ